MPLFFLPRWTVEWYVACLMLCEWCVDQCFNVQRVSARRREFRGLSFNHCFPARYDHLRSLSSSLLFALPLSSVDTPSPPCQSSR